MAESAVKRIGVLTSGGDAPGMNAAVRSVVRSALDRGIECIGIRRGWSGLINGDFYRMDSGSVSRIINRGGTILYTARSEEFRTAEGQAKAAGVCKLLGLDGIVAIGGDGTIIHTAKLAASLGKPILGINAGTLGFTAGLERHELGLLPRLVQGEYREERRRMLSVELESQKGASQSFYALNDAVLSGEPAKIIDYQMVLGSRSYRYRADGFIVATPTGSTAYSLSAGGPVIEPSMDCLVYTPICPHSLFDRSILFSPQSQLVIQIPENTGRLYLSVDGETPLEVFTGDLPAGRPFCPLYPAGRQEFLRHSQPENYRNAAVSLVLLP